MWLIVECGKPLDALTPAILLSLVVLGASIKTVFQKQLSQDEDVFKHFGIKPSHIDFNFEISDSVSSSSESPPQSALQNDDPHTPAPRCRRGAVVGGYKDMAVVHEHHK